MYKQAQEALKERLEKIAIAMPSAGLNSLDDALKYVSNLKGTPQEYIHSNVGGDKFTKSIEDLIAKQKGRAGRAVPTDPERLIHHQRYLDDADRAALQHVNSRLDWAQLRKLREEAILNPGKLEGPALDAVKKNYLEVLQGMPAPSMGIKHRWKALTPNTRTAIKGGAGVLGAGSLYSSGVATGERDARNRFSYQPAYPASV